MATCCLKYCVEVKHDGATALVRMFLDTSQVDMKWTNSSAGSNADAVPWDSFFLKSLTVNPKVLFDIHVPEEWSRVFLLVLYRGHELGEQTNDNKSIWYSSNNRTAFAIVSPSVRTAAQNNIQSLQLRASKSKLINGDRQQNGILPVKTDLLFRSGQTEQNRSAVQSPHCLRNISRQMLYPRCPWDIIITFLILII